nr:PQQ-binding-like beta-propeller repeat protein [Halorussus aquaticus]
MTVSPVVSDGTLYFGYSREATSDERGGAWLEAFDAATGESLWTTELWRSDEFYYFYLSDSLVLTDDRLFVQTKPGLKAVDVDGDEQWVFDNLYQGQQTPDAIPPVVTDDIVVTGTYSTSVAETEQPETVFGLDPDNGTERWRVTLPDLSGMWQLAAADGTVYVPMVESERLIALDIVTGEKQWQLEVPVAGTPTIVDDTLLIPLREHDNQQSIAAVDLPTKTVRWRTPVGARWGDAGLTVADDLVYYVAEFGVEARHTETGERVWRFGGRTEGQPEMDLVSTPVVASDSIYVPGWIQRDTMYGHLFVLDAQTGTEQTRVELGRNREMGRSIPAVTSDLVFAATNTGNLYAFGECGTSILDFCLTD